MNTETTNADIPRAKLMPRSEWEKSDLPEYRLARTLIDACPDKGRLSRDNAVVHEGPDWDDGIQVFVSGGEIGGKSAEELKSTYVSNIRVFCNGKMRGVVSSLAMSNSGESLINKFRTEASEDDFGDPDAPLWKWHFETDSMLTSSGQGEYGFGPYPAFQGA